MMRGRVSVALTALALVGCGSDPEPSAKGPPGGSSPEREGCAPTVKLLEPPADAAARGPWPVGARVIDLQGLSAEVWYPATVGSETGLATKRYDVRTWLPASEQKKIPDADNPWQESTVFADLPLDGEHGPYPIVVFVHGTAGWRTQSLPIMEHWASRGFVVVAADHPGLYLGDLLSFQTDRDLDGDLTKILAGVQSASAGLEFLAGHVDVDRIALVGHSAGGGAVQAKGDLPGVRLLIPLAAGGTQAGSSLESTLVMGGKADAVVAYDKQAQGYDTSPTMKRLVGIEKSGHLFPTDLCHLKNAKGEDLVSIAQKYQIQNAQFASLLFDCPPDEPSAETHRAIVSFATATVLEETLTCDTRVGFTDLQTRFSEVTDFREAL